MNTTTAVARRPGRRWFRFSLRMLLVFVVLVSFPLSRLASHVRRARLQRETVTEIERRGGMAMWCHLMDPPELDWNCPDWLRERLGSDFFTSVNYVTLAGDEFGDGEMELLAGLPELRSLTIQDCAVTDDGLRALRHLPALEGLSIHGGAVSDGALVHVAASPRLDFLNLTNCPITDSGLTNLRRMSRLETLRLTGSQVTDMGLAALADLPQLRVLGLSGTRVTDTGLSRLKPTSMLETLELEDTALTDAGLERLGSLPRLRRLEAANTRITREGVERLKNMAPNLTVIW